MSICVYRVCPSLWSRIDLSPKLEISKGENSIHTWNNANPHCCAAVDRPARLQGPPGPPSPSSVPSLPLLPMISLLLLSQPWSVMSTSFILTNVLSAHIVHWMLYGQHRTWITPALQHASHTHTHTHTHTHSGLMSFSFSGWHTHVALFPLRVCPFLMKATVRLN